MYKNPNKSSKDFTAKPEKYPQKIFKDKPCRRCRQVFSPLAPSHLYCSDECADSAYSDRHLSKTYNLTTAQVKQMHHNQNNKCAICNGDGFKMAEHHKSKLVVDHCHETNTVRGLLCHNCNRALGLFKDSVEALTNAIKYLEGATTIP